eukprot:INCI5888.4.p2 GENE.INCI5888.4~~INCI5888.4.p2  ORF type:complete len:222 (+),score=43.99 INCI5888.4:193-858(+)
MPKKSSGKKKKKKSRRGHHNASKRDGTHRDYLQDADEFDGERAFAYSEKGLTPQQPGDFKHALGKHPPRSSGTHAGHSQVGATGGRAAAGGWNRVGGGAGAASTANTQRLGSSAAHHGQTLGVSGVPAATDFPNLNPTQQLAAVDFLEGSDENDDRQKLEVLALQYMFLEHFTELPRVKHQWIHMLRKMKANCWPKIFTALAVVLVTVYLKESPSCVKNDS